MKREEKIMIKRTTVVILYIHLLLSISGLVSVYLFHT